MAMADLAKPDFGSRMKRLREERGVSLRHIADATKLSVGALEALERNDISRLPGGIYSRGFVRSYAVEIGVDPEQAVRDFIVQFPHDSVTAGSPHVQQDYESATTPQRRVPSLLMIVIALSLIGGIFLYFALSSR